MKRMRERGREREREREREKEGESERESEREREIKEKRSKLIDERVFTTNKQPDIYQATHTHFSLHSPPTHFSLLSHL
jgi:hypothetical protein